MDPAIVALVLCAAVLHAAWNAVLKGGGDRFRAIVAMSVASGLCSLPAMVWLPPPARESWPMLAFSVVVHVAYSLFLVAAYAKGDLGQVYPIARGASPMLVTLGAALLAGEVPNALSLAGIALVSLGILSLARGWWTGASRAGLLAALATGVLIAVYSVADGLGSRRAGSSLSYAAWLFALYALPMAAIYAAKRGRAAPLFDLTRTTAVAVGGGFVSLLAYGIVIYAASRAPLGPVSALRETSVVFAALIGRFALAETLTLQRLSGCVAVALGAILLGYAR